MVCPTISVLPKYLRAIFSERTTELGLVQRRTGISVQERKTVHGQQRGITDLDIFPKMVSAFGNRGGNGVKTVIIFNQIGVLLFEGFGQRRERRNLHAHVGLLPLALDNVLVVNISQISVDLPFVPHVAADQQRKGHTDGQTEDVDKRKYSVFTQRAPTDLEVVLKHGFVRLKWPCKVRTKWLWGFVKKA